MIELLRTKLFIPRPRKNLVARPNLVDCLNEGLDKKLTLIAAPAGFGKTTLLSEWIPQSSRCVTWLSLDDDDNDPVKFWAYFIKSLQSLGAELGAGAFSLLQSPQPPLINSILTALINDIASFSDSFSMVLDDYHVIESHSIHKALTFLIDHQPVNMRIVITTRMDPPLPLARLRANDQLTELRANDLRFSVNEASSFLNQVMGLSLSSEDVTALEARTEGWIAGLQIAALSMQGQGDIQGFIQAFSGSHRHILGYLANEVIDKLPERAIDFLLKTSILESLSGSLCDAVTDDSGGQDLLEELEGANLFVIRLDNEGNWYRYHHLFAEVLSIRLQQTQTYAIDDLHHRACTWYGQHGYIHESVHHALTGHDFERAAHLIEEQGLSLLFGGQIHTVLDWLQVLPDAVMLQHPRLCIDHATGLMLTNQIEAAEKRLQDAECFLQHEIPDDLKRAIEGNVATVRGYIQMYIGDLIQASRLIQRALEILPETTTSVAAKILTDRARSTARVFASTTAHRLTGDVGVAAERLAVEAIAPARATGMVTAMLGGYISLVSLQMMQGRLHAAAATFAEVEQFLLPQNSKYAVVGSPLYYFSKGSLLYKWNDLDAAENYLDRGMELLAGGMATDANVILLGYLALARVQLARGNSEEAMARVDSFIQLGTKYQFFELLIEQAAATRARIQLLQGDLPAALKWVEVSGLSPTDEIYFPREIAHLTLARLRIAAGQAATILPLLDRMLKDAEEKSRMQSVMEILIIRALANNTLSDHLEAQATLECALRLALPEGHIRAFVDEGIAMRHLLLDYRSALKNRIGNDNASESARLLTYTDTLLAAFPQPASTGKLKFEAISESISERELEILQLIAAGKTNHEIAEKLVIAVSTVKSHINNLYGKLGTNRRTEAVAIAREQGLLTY